MKQLIKLNYSNDTFEIYETENIENFKGQNFEIIKPKRENKKSPVLMWLSGWSDEDEQKNVFVYLNEAEFNSLCEAYGEEYEKVMQMLKDIFYQKSTKFILDHFEDVTAQIKKQTK